MAEDMRTPQTIARKRGEANNSWEIVTTKRQEAHEATNMAERKQREEAITDRKATKADRHSEELRRRREHSLAKIAGNHQIIDNCDEQGNIMFQFMPTTGRGKNWGILIFRKKMGLSDRYSLMRL